MEQLYTSSLTDSRVEEEKKLIQAENKSSAS